jgi:hypothetical protein
MPTYDYRCQANNQVVEAWHGMNERITTWGELCAVTGRPTGETPSDSPVEKLATGGQVVRSSSLKDGPAPCAAGPCCGGGACDLG